MDFNNIKTFLDKFREIIFQKEEINKNIARIISEEIKSEINEKLITIKNDCIFVKVPPVFHSEILIHKDKILTRINSLNSGRRFNNIR